MWFSGRDFNLKFILFINTSVRVQLHPSQPSIFKTPHAHRANTHTSARARQPVNCRGNERLNRRTKGMSRGDLESITDLSSFARLLYFQMTGHTKPFSPHNNIKRRMTRSGVISLMGAVVSSVMTRVFKALGFWEGLQWNRALCLYTQITLWRQGRVYICDVVVCISMLK